MTSIDLLLWLTIAAACAVCAWHVVRRVIGAVFPRGREALEP